jgi:hypothetical protein
VLDRVSRNYAIGVVCRNSARPKGSCLFAHPLDLNIVLLLQFCLPFVDRSTKTDLIVCREEAP